MAETAILPELIEDILTQYHCHEQRCRDLPAMLVFWVCIAVGYTGVVRLGWDI